MFVINLHFGASDMSGDSGHACWTFIQLFHRHRKASELRVDDPQRQSLRFTPAVDSAPALHLSPPVGTSGTCAANCKWAIKSSRVSTWAKRSALAADSTLLNFLR